MFNYYYLYISTTLYSVIFNCRTEADDEEFQQFLRESDEKFEAQEEGLKETYENLGINLQDISDKLENTTKELNEIYANANSSNSPSAYDLCEEIDEQIRKMKELIATTSAEICNAVNKQTEKMKETKQVSELADNIGNIVIEEKGIVQDERKKHKKSTK